MQYVHVWYQSVAYPLLNFIIATISIEGAKNHVFTYENLRDRYKFFVKGVYYSL